MPVYIVTGKLGGGKSLVSVARIRDYIRKGSLIATNLDLVLHRMFDESAKGMRVLRVPDKPSIADLNAIGRGNETYDESKNGLLVLDECGTWFNSRNWSDKARKPVNDWFLHARKLGWDVLLIIQNVSMLDSQARDAIAEHTVFCSRLDRLQVPYIGFIFKAFFGERLPLPRVHSARVVYGTTSTDLLADRWVYRGTDLFKAYDTKQLFLDDYPHGTHSLLTPWHLRGRYKKPWTMEKLMQLAIVKTRRFRSALFLSCGVFLGLLLSLAVAPFLLASMQERANLLPPMQSPVAAALDVVEPLEGEVSQVEQPDILSDASIQIRFAGFRIAAYVSNGSRRVYQVQDSEGKTFTDDQLRALGFMVMPVSECELMVATSDTFREKTSIFSPSCVPRDSDKQTDLTSMPYFDGTKPAIYSLLTPSKPAAPAAL